MKSIRIRTQFEAFHQYDNAPEEVSFLRHSHRHMFHVLLEIGVDHNNRDIEFFILKKQLAYFVEIAYKGRQNIGSCEMIGEEVLKNFKLRYPNRFIEVIVSEDLESDARINNIEE